MLGLESTSHQPVVPIAEGSSSDVKKRPIVGTSQSSPMKARRRYTGVFARKRTSFADIGSETSAGAPTRASTGAVTVDIRPPSGSVAR